MTEKFSFPFKLVNEDNGACGDPECCGYRESWVEIRDSNGREVFNGSWGDEDSLALIEKAFRALYREEPHA